MSKNYDYSKIAKQYNETVELYKWSAPELIFDYLRTKSVKGADFLDIGIGSGVSSQRLTEIGANIYGVDNSEEFLEVCKQKNFCSDVELWDINSDKLPFNGRYFEYVICSGVLHFFGELKEIFQKVTRMLKRSGEFIFTAQLNKDGNETVSYETSGVNVYQHPELYVEEVCKTVGLTIIDIQHFDVIADLKLQTKNRFSLLIAKKL